MCGMTVHSAPDNGLVLQPMDNSRVYYLRAMSAVDQKRWKYLLRVRASVPLPCNCAANASACSCLCGDGDLKMCIPNEKVVFD